MMLSAPTSSATAIVSRNSRNGAENAGPATASTPSRNAVSVEITTPQARACSPDGLSVRNTRAGTARPATDATSGTVARWASVSPPISSSRRSSRPTTKKKNTIRPSLTQCRRSSDSSSPPRRSASSVCQKLS